MYIYIFIYYIYTLYLYTIFIYYICILYLYTIFIYYICICIYNLRRIDCGQQVSSGLFLKSRVRLASRTAVLVDVLLLETQSSGLRLRVSVFSV